MSTPLHCAVLVPLHAVLPCSMGSSLYVAATVTGFMIYTERHDWPLRRLRCTIRRMSVAMPGFVRLVFIRRRIHYHRFMQL